MLLAYRTVTCLISKITRKSDMSYTDQTDATDSKIYIFPQKGTLHRKDIDYSKDRSLRHAVRRTRDI